MTVARAETGADRARRPSRDRRRGRTRVPAAKSHDGVMTESGPHRYRASCGWEGSTGMGYDHYDRSHWGRADPAPVHLEMSSDPAFLGRAERLNPEQLLLLAASSCQLLAFLAVAARARVDVVAYEDDAEAVMPTDDRPLRLTRIWLRPHITVHAPATEERVRRLAAVAHRECFIANSLNGRMEIDPTVVILPADPAIRPASRAARED